MPRTFALLLGATVLTAPAGSAGAQARDSVRVSAQASVLSGKVKDEYGDPLAGAEVRIQPGSHVSRTDSSGIFRIEVTPGEYTATFRRLGYEAEDFSWRARAGQTTSLSIRLDPVPHALDTVVVRDRHDRVAGASSIMGVVVDTGMRAIPGVELQLIGTGRHAVTYEDGTFFFAGLAEGNYVVRARRMGFTPANLTVRIGSGERHEVAIKLTSLMNTLATVEIMEQSGFGSSAPAWQEFDRRQRWKSASSATVGRDELARLGRMPLDLALLRSPAGHLDLPWFGSRGHTSILSQGGSGGAINGDPADQCVLVNGLIGERRPLSSFDAQQVERVEVYPGGTEWTGTIGARMVLVKGCEPISFLQHPPYFVVWMRGGS